MRSCFAAGWIVGLCGVGALAYGQQSLPAGTTLPVALTHGLKAGKTVVGAPVEARLSQRVPLPGGKELAAGTRLTGRVVASTAGPQGELALRLDTLLLDGRSVPLVAAAVALASFVEVDRTFEQVGAAADRGNPSSGNWTTRQVGGDEVVRERWVGPLLNQSTQVVGSADYNGVYALSVGGAPAHALGVFSADAHGLYGFSENTRMQGVGGMTRLFGPRVSLKTGDQILLSVE